MIKTNKMPPQSKNPAERKAPYQVWTWAWLLHRVSAVLIAICVGLHLWQRHLGPYGKEVTFENAAQRLESPIWIAVAIIFAAVAVYHALNGLRAIINDFVSGERAQTVIFWIVLLGAIGVFISYVVLLIPFIVLYP